MRRHHTNTCCWDAVLPSSRPKAQNERELGCIFFILLKFFGWGCWLVPWGRRLGSWQRSRQWTRQTQGQEVINGQQGYRVQSRRADGKGTRGSSCDCLRGRQREGQMPGRHRGRETGPLCKAAREPLVTCKDLQDWRPALDNLVYRIRDMFQKLFKNDWRREKSVRATDSCWRVGGGSLPLPPC